MQVRLFLNAMIKSGDKNGARSFLSGRGDTERGGSTRLGYGDPVDVLTPFFSFSLVF
jgi:hypothetical protein